MKSWAKIGAICEHYGDGRGTLLRVVDIEGDRLMLLDIETGVPSGWVYASGCYRTDKARRAEKNLCLDGCKSMYFCHKKKGHRGKHETKDGHLAWRAR